MITAHAAGALRSTAGALRLIEARSTHPRTVDIAAYVQAVSAHCPYLAPSLERELTGWTVYEASGDAGAVEAEVFHAAVQAAEWVRPLASRRHGMLVCENIVVLGADAGTLVWPHWALKNLYGPVGLMFGKFTAGEVRGDLPVPPVSFLPVRVAVRPRDPRFLGATPELAAAVAEAVDDGHDVLDGIGHDWTEIRQWAQHLLPKR